MVNKQLVEELLYEAIDAEKEFLVEFNISASSNITVLVDSMDGLTIQRCVEISRHIEHNLDREEADFDLRVSSPGLGESFVVPQQYKKNLGRNLEIVTNAEEKIEGELISFEGTTVTIKTERMERVEGKKKKQLIVEEKQFSLENIKTAKVIIAFK